MSVFGAADPYAAPGDSAGGITARLLLDRGVERIDTALADEPEIRTELRGALGRIYRNLGVYDKAADQLERTLRERHALHGGSDPRVAEAMDQLGQVRVKQGELPAADSLLTGALDLRRRLLGTDQDATAESLEHLADLRFKRNDFAGAEPLMREALAIQSRLNGDSSLAVATAKLALAELLRTKGSRPRTPWDCTRRRWPSVSVVWARTIRSPPRPSAAWPARWRRWASTPRPSGSSGG